jgi:hypothetical protein
VTHVGTRGGPRGDDELPPLRPELAGLKGVELMRAAHELTRPRSATQRARTTPFVAPRPPGRPENGAAASPAWSPHDAIPEEPTVAHWADDIPVGPEPEEEDWR